jgi:hypothetical protein
MVHYGEPLLCHVKHRDTQIRAVLLENAQQPVHVAGPSATTRLSDRKSIPLEQGIINDNNGLLMSVSLHVDEVAESIFHKMHPIDEAEVEIATQHIADGLRSEKVIASLLKKSNVDTQVARELFYWIDAYRRAIG